MNTHGLRTLVRGAYDMQKIRIQVGNRIAMNYLNKTSVSMDAKQEGDDEKTKQAMDLLRASYTTLTNGLKKLPRQSSFKGDGVISDYTELCLMQEFVELEAQEKQHFRRLASILNDYPVWTEFLLPIRGIGPAMGGILISEINIAAAKYPSSLWKYCGLDVAQDGFGRSRRTEHLVNTTYTAKDGSEKTRVGITFNPFLKTKLMGVLAPSFLRVGENKYRTIYLDYKHRLEHHSTYGTHNDEFRKETFSTQGKGYAPTLHRHNMALRYMIKQFLVDLHCAWRALEGLPVAAPYAAAKLGYTHGTTAVHSE